MVVTRCKGDSGGNAVSSLPKLRAWNISFSAGDVNFLHEENNKRHICRNQILKAERREAKLREGKYQIPSILACFSFCLILYLCVFVYSALSDSSIK